MNKDLSTHWPLQGLLLVVAMMLAGFYALHLGQDSNFDLRNYHWYNAYSFLHHRFDVDIAAGSKPTYNNPVLDTVNYLLIKAFPKSHRAEFALGAIHGISVFFLFNIALVVFKRFSLRWLYALLATAVGVTGVASLHQIGTTYNESQVTVFVMASLFLFTRAIDTDSNRFRDYALAGLVLGIGTAAKLTSFCYGLGLFASLACYRKWDVAHVKLIFIAGITALLGFLMIDGFWMLKLYRHFQSPLFPFYNTIFHSSFMVDKDLVYKEWVPKSIGQGLLYPFYWLKENKITQEFWMKDPRVAVMIVLGAIVLAKHAIMRRVAKGVEKNAPPFSPTLRFLLLFFGFSYAIWMIEFSIYRYTIPLNFVSGIFIIYFGCVIFKPGKLQWLAALFIAALVIQQTDSPPWDRKPYFKYFFTIEIPPPLPHDALVLIGSYAVSYIAAFLPESNQFVGYYNSMVQPFNAKLFNIAATRIAQFKNPLYVIYIDEDSARVRQNLAENQLYIADDCRVIKSNLEVEPIQLCSVIRGA